MAINAIFPAVQGIEYGLLSIETKRLEDSVRAGENTYMTAVLQIAQGAKALDFIGMATEAAGFAAHSWAEKSVVYLTPPLLAILKNTNLVPDNLRPAIQFIQNHLSAVYQLASIVSSVALLYFGHTLFAAAALTTLGLGILSQNGLLPFMCRQIINQYSQPLMIATGLIAGTGIDQMFAVLNAISWCADAYLAPQSSLRLAELPQGNLDLGTAQRYLAGGLRLEIDRKFIHYNPFPPVPQIDIQTLVTQFEQIDWEQHITPLRRKLKEDPRFVARHRAPDLLSDREIIEFAKQSLQNFVTSVKEKRVLEGEPTDYEKLHNYLKIIAKHVQDQEDEITQTDILLRLAVEGGEYCGPGKFEVAESIYAQTIGENPDIPLRDKILHCLQDKRNSWAQKIYFEVYLQNKFAAKIGKIFDWQDVHNYNVFVNLFADELGLRKAGADNDDTAIVDPLLKWLISCTMKDYIHKLFWRSHELNHQSLALKDAIGTPKLPKPEIYAFWQNWIENQAIDERQKEELQEELANGNLFNRPLEIEGMMTFKFIDLMLLDMGIAKIVRAPENQQAPNLQLLNPAARHVHA